MECHKSNFLRIRKNTVTSLTCQLLFCAWMCALCIFRNLLFCLCSSWWWVHFKVLTAQKGKKMGLAKSACAAILVSSSVSRKVSTRSKHGRQTLACRTWCKMMQFSKSRQLKLKFPPSPFFLYFEQQHSPISKYPNYLTYLWFHQERNSFFEDNRQCTPKWL